MKVVLVLTIRLVYDGDVFTPLIYLWAKICNAFEYILDNDHFTN
jgi:hypothetical protein